MRNRFVRRGWKKRGVSTKISPLVELCLMTILKEPDVIGPMLVMIVETDPDHAIVDDLQQLICCFNEWKMHVSGYIGALVYIMCVSL